MSKHLSPTNVATYYHNQCHLYLHNSYHRPHEIGSKSKAAKETSPLATAQFQRGLEWEARLFRFLEVQNQLVRLDPASEPKSAQEIRDLIVETASQLSIGSSRYIANLAFQSPSFTRELAEFHSDPDSVTFGVAKPDLVKITHLDEDHIVWEIIDAKSSSTLKSSHNAQIGFYHICLEAFMHSVSLEKQNSPKIISSEKASIWLPNDANDESIAIPVSTPISLLLPPLRLFLFKTLPHILKLPRDRVEWHLNPSCQGCGFMNSCKDTTVKDGRLGMIPNLSASEARFVREVMGIAADKGLAPSSEDLTDIEELDSLVKSNGMGTLERTYAATAKRFQRILGVQKSSSRRWSPLLDAAISREPHLTKKRVFTFPRTEDVAIYVSVIIDVARNCIGAFCCSILLPPDKSKGHLMSHVVGSSHKFVPSVAAMLRELLTHSPKARTQVYTYSPAERSIIMSHLIQSALSTSPDDAMNDDIRLCLGALYEGTALLLTSFQPSILSGALLSFLSKKNTLTKNALQICCERLGLSQDGTVEVLRKRIESEQRRLAEIGGRVGDDPHKREAGQLGKVVVLKREVERLVSLPIPGFVDLPQTGQALLTKPISCDSDDVLFGEWSKKGAAARARAWEQGLKDRNRCMRAVVNNVRERIRNAGLTAQVLLNEAKPVEVGMMDICQSTKLRKLMFMLQFEVLVRLNTLWEDRLDGCPNAPLLRYVGAEKKGTIWNQVFDVVSGTIEPSVEDRAFYGWLLVAEPDPSLDQLPVPPEIYFDDLGLCGLFFPLTKYTKPKWEEQPLIVRNEIFVANVTDMRLGTSDADSKKPSSQAIIQTMYTGKNLTRGALYRISPRLVDFNLSRVLLNLVTMDFQESFAGEEAPFIQLITDLQTFTDSPSFCGEAEERREKEIVRGLNDLAKLGNKHAEALVLKKSQHRAAMRMMMKRFSVIWGPPGTGKTYTLALSTLRMIEVLGSRAIQLCPIILVTAMTHAAIEAIFSKINSLIDHYRALKERDSSWLDVIDLQRVLSGATHLAPTSKRIHIYAGTTYQLYKFCDKAKLTARSATIQLIEPRNAYSAGQSLILIDESGQLALGIAALVIRWLSPTGKLVLAGDHEQLAPILGTVYPEAQGEPPLFGSILDMLMVGRQSGLKVAETIQSLSQSQDQEKDYNEAVVQLLENFRLNEDLGTFVELIYAKKFRPMKSQAAEIAESLQLWLDTEPSDDPVMEQSRMFLINLSKAMSQKRIQNSKLKPPRVNSVLTLEARNRPVSLALVRVSASKSSITPYETHVKAEARLAASLVHWLRESFGAEETIFVACPHRIQRSAVRQAIVSPGEDWGSDQIEDNVPESDVDALTAELAAFHVSENGLRIDTVERLQGSEASFVIFLLSHTHLPSLGNHLEFLLSRRRLNVGISRAKALCILVSSRGVLQPSLEVLAKEEPRKGLEFLRAYEDRAWIGDIELAV